MVNTVDRAQVIAKALKDAMGNENVTLVHARFIMPDRIEKEESMLARLGKHAAGRRAPGFHVVVGTQVIEQSLDLDFDVLFTDICPMDLLLQRVGRLHRHQKSRPDGLETAACYILGACRDDFDKGTLAVYHAYPLIRTRAMLPAECLYLPRDISTLVQNVYDDTMDLENPPEQYDKAKTDWQLHVSHQEGRAKAYRLGAPHPDAELTGWLDMSLEQGHHAGSQGIHEAAGEAAVRDSGDSVEVLLVQSLDGTRCAPLPWIAFPAPISMKSLPRAEEARILARQSLRLPHTLCHKGIIDQTIRELETNNQALAAWQASPWLKGSLFLQLDADFKATLCGFELVYSRGMGLSVHKEGSGYAD